VFTFSVIPVKTGIQNQENDTWIPASAGMTAYSTFFMIFQSAKLINFIKPDLWVSFEI